MYAVVQTGAKQYRVSQGDTLEVERIATEKGAEVVFDQVLLIAEGDKIQVGTPMLAGAKVTGEVVEHKRGPKLIAFKMRRREGYHRKMGHRQELTVVKVRAIQGS
jgi:large subunit ribosomal protein L21